MIHKHPKESSECRTEKARNQDITQRAKEERDATEAESYGDVLHEGYFWTHLLTDDLSRVV